jgi:hypothetical protein
MTWCLIKHREFIQGGYLVRHRGKFTFTSKTLDLMHNNTDAFIGLTFYPTKLTLHSDASNRSKYFLLIFSAWFQFLLKCFLRGCCMFHTHHTDFQDPMLFGVPTSKFYIYDVSIVILNRELRISNASSGGLYEFHENRSLIASDVYIHNWIKDQTDK